MKSKGPRSNGMRSVWVFFRKEIFKFGFIGKSDMKIVGTGVLDGP